VIATLLGEYMKSVQTNIPTLPANPIEKCGYLVYGESKPADVVGRFEGWYWIDIPGDDPIRVAGPSRLGLLTYATAGEAIAMALQDGVSVAGELPSARGAN